MGTIYKRVLGIVMALLLAIASVGCQPAPVPAYPRVEFIAPTAVSLASPSSAAVLPTPAATEPLALVLPTATPVPVELPAPTVAPTRETSRRTVPFDAMQYQRPDAQALVEELNRAAQDIAQASSGQAQYDRIEAAWAGYETYYTMYILAQIHLDEDAKDAYWQAENDYMAETSTDVDYALLRMYQALLDSPYREELEVLLGEESLEDMRLAVESRDARIQSLLMEEEKLVVAYRRLAATGTVEMDGRELTYGEIEALYLEEGYGPYIQALQAWLEQHNATLGDIYLQLVQVRQEMARQMGYENYVEMAYAERGYDYAPEDVAAVREAIKEELVPVYQRLSWMGYGMLPDVSVEENAFSTFLRETLYGLDTSLGEAFDFMEAYQLARMEPGVNKASGAYTTYLYDFDAPVIVGSWLGDAMSISTWVHEFGHFHDFYAYYEETEDSTLDTAEIFSTGLEMLVANHYASLLDEETAAWLQEAMVVQLLDTYVCQTSFEEFEARVYQLDSEDLTLDRVNAIFREVQQAYGLAVETAPWYDLYGWITISHYYEAPFYTFSYTAASDVALQLWQISDRDEDRAVAAYFALLEREDGADFQENVQAAGLETVFSEGRIEKVAAYYKAIFLENAA